MQPTPTTFPHPNSLVVRTRLGDGLLVGTAASVIAGVAWWALCSFGQFDAWPFTSPLVGIVVGTGVVIGARRGGAGPAAIAGVLALVTTLVAVYFIDRSLQIAALADAGRTVDVPLWQGFSHATEVITDWIDLAPEKAVGWLLAPLTAIAVSVGPNRRPLFG